MLSCRSRALLFRIVEREPIRQAAPERHRSGRARGLGFARNGTGAGTYAPVGAAASAGGGVSLEAPFASGRQNHDQRPSQQHHHHHHHRAEANVHPNANAQRMFESKWRGPGAQTSSSASSTRAAPLLNQRRAYDAVGAEADQLRDDVAAAAMSSVHHGASRRPPTRFGELPLYADSAAAGQDSSAQRRAALKRMREAAVRGGSDFALPPGHSMASRADDERLSTIEIARDDDMSIDDRLAELNAASPRHTVLSGRSALARGVLLRNSLPSRSKHSSWDAVGLDESRARHNTTAANSGDGGADRATQHPSSAPAATTPESSLLAEVAQRSTLREWEASEAHYRHTFDAATTLEHHRDSVQHTRSVYAQRSLQLPGLFSYHGFVTALEERNIVAELTRLLLRPAARFHSEEGRYCVNLFERRLLSLSNDGGGGGGADPLAFSLPDDAPALLAVLERAARLGLIPSVPNVAQVSEMVSAYAGYAPQLKHPSIGAYFGVLNFVSPAQLSLVHVDQPWSPKVMLVPRAMYVLGATLFRQYRVGYARLDSAVAVHQEQARFTKDYRIEVVFATVEPEAVPRLAVPVRATEYAERRRRQLDSGGRDDGDA